jgi:hypothetical protein
MVAHRSLILEAASSQVLALSQSFAVSSPPGATCDDRVKCERGLVVRSENDDAIFNGFA